MRETRRPEERPEDPVRRIAETVLYEGYLLWPYRRSALKNRQRWTFGGVFPRAWSRLHPDDAWWMRTECLVEAEPGARVDVELRFLHVVERRVARLGPEGLTPVDALDAGDRRILAWDEATEREVRTPPLRLDDLQTPFAAPVAVAAGEQLEAVEGPEGPAGALRRRWQGLEGELSVAARRLAPGLFRLRATVRNTTPCPEGPRSLVQRRSFASTHTLLRGRGARFVSATDPPPALRARAEACRNVGTWPVLVGEPGERHTVLSSPIILPDHPRIAPESPGDLFDATEIDQLLVLSLLALTDEERREMAASDPRARAILERTEALSPDALRRLHGAVRELRPLGGSSS